VEEPNARKVSGYRPGGTVKLTRIVRDDPFDVGLPLFVSGYPSRRSTPGRNAFLTDGGEQPVAGDGLRQKDSERCRVPTRIVAREPWI
jgi:hypothetical protein